jgi:hypothetical protein
MSDLQASTADEADIQLYTEGSCHALAVALHRNLGFGFLVVTDPDNPYWEDEADGDNAIPSVTHVLAVDADGNAWDVLGVRPAAAVREEILDRHPDVRSIDSDEFQAERGLSTYVDGMGDGECGDEVDRPLHAISDADVAEAWECALRVLADVPGFQASRGPAPG